MSELRRIQIGVNSLFCPALWRTSSSTVFTSGPISLLASNNCCVFFMIFTFSPNERKSAHTTSLHVPLISNSSWLSSTLNCLGDKIGRTCSVHEELVYKMLIRRTSRENRTWETWFGWKDNIKMDLEGNFLERCGWGQWRTIVNMVMNVWVLQNQSIS